MISEIELVDHLYFGSVNGKAIFKNTDVEHGSELWYTDGTYVGLYHDLQEGDADGVMLNDQLEVSTVEFNGELLINLMSDRQIQILY